VATADVTRRAWARRLPGAREVVAGSALAGMVGAGLLLAAAVASGPSQFVRWSLEDYPGWLSGPLAGLTGSVSVGEFIGLTALMYALYLVVVALGDALRLSWLLAAIAALHLIFLLGPPMYLTDVFNYIGYARLDALHGLSPYTHEAVEVPGDRIVDYMTWADLTSPYGPLFTVPSYLLVPLGIAGGVWAYKITVFLAGLGCVALVWLIARQLGRPAVPALALFGLNPLLVVYGVGGAHNDMFMLLGLLGGILLLLRGREALGAGAVAAAAAIKATAGLALPFMWLASRRRGRVLLGAAAALAGVVVLAVATYGGEAPDALASFNSQGEFSELRSVPGQVADGLLGRESVPALLKDLAFAGFVLVFVLLWVRAWRRGADWLDSLGWATLALLLSLTWLMPWYVVWLLPFAAVSRSRRLRWVTLAFGVFLLVVHLPYEPTI
jgi:Glycosyltransferase family 87